MSKRYMVKSLAVSGIGKKVYHNGDFVTDADFPEGAAAVLLKARHLRAPTKSEQKTFDELDKKAKEVAKKETDARDAKLALEEKQDKVRADGKAEAAKQAKIDQDAADKKAADEEAADEAKKEAAKKAEKHQEAETKATAAENEADALTNNAEGAREAAEKVSLTLEGLQKKAEDSKATQPAKDAFKNATTSFEGLNKTATEAEDLAKEKTEAAKVLRQAATDLAPKDSE